MTLERAYGGTGQKLFDKISENSRRIAYEKLEKIPWHWSGDLYDIRK